MVVPAFFFRCPIWRMSDQAQEQTIVWTHSGTSLPPKFQELAPAHNVPFSLLGLDLGEASPPKNSSSPEVKHTSSFQKY